MSGEVVLVSSALGPLGAVGIFAGGMLGIAAATLAAQAVASYLEFRRAEAARIVAQEQEKLEVWRDFQAEHAQRMTNDRENLMVFRGQLSALRLVTPSDVTQTNEVSTRGFLEEESGLVALEKWFTSLPVALHNDPDFPLVSLEGQWRRFQAQAAAGRPPAVATVAAFRVTLEQTLVNHLERLDREQSLRTERLARVKQLLEETLRCRYTLLSGHGQTDLGIQLATLYDGLLAHLATGEITEGRLETLESQGEKLSAAVAVALEHLALLTVLRDRTTAHLGELGYTLVASEEDGAQWRIPGGERVRMKIQRDHRLAFQVIHERPPGANGALNRTELDRLRTQETRWCTDAKELLRRLIRDGFAYSLQFERALPLASIPVVVLESATELADDEEESQRDDRHRLHDLYR